MCRGLRQNISDDKWNKLPGLNKNFNTNMSKIKAIRILNIDRNYSQREMRVKQKILAVKHCPDK